MDIFENFDNYLAASSAQIPIIDFIINLVLTGLLSILISWVYARYGYSISNRKIFGRNLFIISMTTMVIISVVKSSLALSLGLVGALSIIRFRTAIKEPEELAYLFLSITVGLGFGANQGAITIIALLIILLSIILFSKMHSKHSSNNVLNLIISSSKPTKADLSKIINILDKNCSNISMKRYDDNEESFEASFLVEFSSYDNFLLIKKEIGKLDKKITLSYLENSNIGIG